MCPWATSIARSGIVIAIAGLAFGQDAAQNAITGQLGGSMGQQTAEVLQTAVASAATDTRAATAEKTVVEPLLAGVLAFDLIAQTDTC